MERKAVVKFALLLALMAFFVYMLRFSDVASRISPGAIREVVLSFGFFGYGVFILGYGVATMLAVPGTLLSFSGAILFGTALGTVMNVLGATLGETLAFFAAKFLGRDFVQGFLEGRLDRFQSMVEKNGFTVMLLLRLVPIFPFVVVNYAAGLSKMRFRDYFFASMIGIIPGTFVYTYLFATLGERVLTSGFEMKDLLTVDVLAPVMLFVLLLVSTLIYKKKLEKKHGHKV